jgi:hypothetical protein
MSVSIFGSNGNQSSDVDEKFTQLSINLAYYKTYVDEKLATKLDKSGGVLTGNINLNNNRILNVNRPQEPTDAANMRYVDGLRNNVLHYPLTHDVNFSNKRIHFVGDPINPQDAVNKRYVDAKFLTTTNTDVGLDMNEKYITGLSQDLREDSQAMSWHQVRDFVFKTVNAKRVKNNVGFIPDVYGRGSKKGFVVSTNSQLNSNSSPKSIFNDGSYEWSSSGLQENVWLQIQLPIPVSIWKFTIAGKMNNLERWYDWNYEGSKDTIAWTILKSATGGYLGSTMKTYFLTEPSEPFLYYRFYGIKGEPTNPGLSHLQIYTVDDLV